MISVGIPAYSLGSRPSSFAGSENGYSEEDSEETNSSDDDEEPAKKNRAGKGSYTTKDGYR